MSKKFESDTISIMTCLSEHGYTTLEHIGECTGISVYDVRRYILPDVWEKRPVEKMSEWREKNFPLYYKLLNNCTYLGNGEVKINTSKYEYLEKYAIQHGFTILKTTKYPFISVHRNDGASEFHEYDDSVKNTGRGWIPIRKN